MEEVLKLNTLLNLRTLTLYGNPISRINNFRRYILSYLPQIRSLDFSLITRDDRYAISPIRYMVCMLSYNTGWLYSFKRLFKYLVIPKKFVKVLECFLLRHYVVTLKVEKIISIWYHFSEIILLHGHIQYTAQSIDTRCF